jgi:biotin carboxylase
VRVLLSDGSGLTARQVATQLSRIGHTVEVLTPDPLALTRFTRHVRRTHRVPPYGSQPFAWLATALAVYESGGFDVLFPTQEQVAVLSRSAEQLQSLGVATAVPAFDRLARVQDKLAAFATLTEFELPQPSAFVAATAEQLAACDQLPVFVKTPIGTATRGVRYVADRASLAHLATDWKASGVFADDGGVLVQLPVTGPLVMIQGVFCNGKLVAWHANLRVREGASGGASHKRSVDLPVVHEHLTTLGSQLDWHGALSADAIVTDDGPVYIDINPRLVEPANAWRAGVDLVTPMLDIARRKSPSVQHEGTAGVATHQLLLAVLGAAQHRHTRRAVGSEVVAAARHRGSYRDSVEELTPLSRDYRAAIPVSAATLATLVRPAAWRWFSSGAVTSYALTPASWRAIVDGAPA